MREEGEGGKGDIQERDLRRENERGRRGKGDMQEREMKKWEMEIINKQRL